MNIIVRKIVDTNRVLTTSISEEARWIRIRCILCDHKGMTKAYQVKQVLKAIERMENQENAEE